MTRLFFSSLPEHPDTITLDRSHSHYIREVLRARAGDKIVLFNGSGRELIGRIVDLKNDVVLSIEEERISDIKPAKHIVLAQGTLKGQKMDLVVQKACELGMKTFFPVITGRSQVRMTAKLPRWRKIAAEASQQCRRTDVMDVHEVMTLDRFLSFISRGYPDALKLVFYEAGGDRLTGFEERVRASQTIVLLTGPEGGFSPDEINLLVEGGFETVYLGKMILRAETASIIAAGIVQYISGNFS